jgi:hypothetical protein
MGRPTDDGPEPEDCRIPGRGLDHERRRALAELTSLLTQIEVGLKSATDAALNLDAEGLSAAAAALCELATDRSLDLSPLTEIYNRLRVEVAASQPIDATAIGGAIDDLNLGALPSRDKIRG